MGVVLFCVLVLAAELKGLHVEGPSGPLVVHLGGSVLLPCSAQDPLPLEDLRVEWRRTDSESVVNVLQQKDIRADLQSETFRGRANFFPEEISKGNFSILLSDITREDAGVYRSLQDLSETPVEVQLSGFSSLQIFILVLCFISLTLSVGLGVPVFIFLQKQETARWVMIMDIVLSLCPNICMFTAFVLWSTEGDTCLKPLVLMMMPCAVGSRGRNSSVPHCYLPLLVTI